MFFAGREYTGYTLGNRTFCARRSAVNPATSVPGPAELDIAMSQASALINPEFGVMDRNGNVLINVRCFLFRIPQITRFISLAALRTEELLPVLSLEICMMIPPRMDFRLM